MSWCPIALLFIVVLLLVHLLMMTCNHSDFSMQERGMDPVARFSGFVNDFAYDSMDALNNRFAEPINKKKVNDDYIYNGGFLDQNLAMEHFDSSDYYSYDPMDNGGVDFNTIDSHMQFAKKLSKEHNKFREANHEFEETPYIKQDARAMFRPNL